MPDPNYNPNAAMQTQGMNTGDTPQSPINTGTPTPATAPTTSPTTKSAINPNDPSIVNALNATGQNSSFSSRTALATKYGITGYTGTADQNTQLLQKYTAGLATAKAGNTPPPSSQGDASAAVTGITGGPTPPPPPPSPVETAMANDPGFQLLLQDQKDFLSSQNQQESLTQQYQDLSKSLGLPAIDAQLINMKAVMDGSEQDIRNEITSAGGFATNSQVLALTASRNKLLTQNYNNLLLTQQNAETQLNTLTGLAKEDRANAISTFNEKINFDKQVSDYYQKFQTNAQNAYDSIIKAPGYGYSALYKSAGGDANTIHQIESTLGLAPGMLSKLATDPQALQWTAPYSLGGNLVQRNNLTGEIRTSVSNPTVGSTGSPGGAFTAGAANFWAQAASSGVNMNNLLPSLGVGSAAVGVKTALLQKMADNAQVLGIDGSTFAAILADSRAKQTTYTQLQKIGTQTQVNEANANKDFTQLIALSQKMDKTSMSLAIPALNNLLRSGQVSLTGNADVNNFMAVLSTSLTEYAKVVSGATGGAAVTDSANGAIQKLLSAGLSTATIQSFAKTAQQEMNNRTSSYNASLEGLFSNIQNVQSTNNTGGLGGSDTGTQSSLAPDIQKQLSSELTFSGTTAYLTASQWATYKTAGIQDQVLQEAKNDGYNLLIK